MFVAVAPALDSLGAMLAELGPDGSRQTRTQAGAVASTPRNVLQTPGCEAFHAEVGEPFTPAQMEPSATLTAHPAWCWPRCGPAGLLDANSAAADLAADRGGQT